MVTNTYLWTEKYIFLYLVKEIPIAFNYSAATAKEFEAEYDFKRPPKKEGERNKTIVLVADSTSQNSEERKSSEDIDDSDNEVW